jgi:hypothetical protein
MAAKEIEQPFRWDDIGDLVIGKIAPALILAKAITNHNISPWSQTGRDVGADEPRASGDNNQRWKFSHSIFLWAFKPVGGKDRES